MKKNLILSAALLLSATAAMAQSGTFTLKANLKNFGKSNVSLETLYLPNGSIRVFSLDSSSPKSSILLITASYTLCASLSY